ncbi:sigma factor-like helix-turn-helix DNA-binding protein [Peribacillus sp. FSL K6-1552]|uniref:sigma factor-like helix-turn-helix DNA-binding protein n=1 Tax=Peribacillus sp. FSL K6-1552 TaxID=2954514 RepID=UPI0030F64213
MENEEDCCCEFVSFIKTNEDFLNNPVIKGFLSKKDNYRLFKQSICHPTQQNQELLDQAFQAFYFYVRFTAYVSSTLYFHGINLDKKFQKVNNRFPLTLDQPVNDDSEVSLKDLVRHNEDFEIESENILDYIIDPNLYKGIQNITPNQKRILYLVYIKNFTDSEVGILLKKTQQAVSKSRNKALIKLRRYMNEKLERTSM